MSKLQDFIYNYGTQGLDVLIQTFVAEIDYKDDQWLKDTGQLIAMMSTRLAEALKEVQAPKKEISDVES